jgi:hypothetical protein
MENLHKPLELVANLAIIIVAIVLGTSLPAILHRSTDPVETMTECHLFARSNA